MHKTKEAAEKPRTKPTTAERTAEVAARRRTAEK